MRMNLKLATVILGWAVLLAPGRAAEVKVPEPVYVSGRVQFPLNGLTFNLTEAAKWEPRHGITTPSLHLTISNP